MTNERQLQEIQKGQKYLQAMSNRISQQRQLI